MGAFEHVVGSVEELREVVPEPGALSLNKEVSALDEHCRAFVERSPLVLVGTAAADGRCDVSPRGGPPGFVAVLDERRLAVPDLPGNRRLDSLRNVVENPCVGLLFLIPGLDETLRVEGRAWVVRDDDVLARCEVRGRRRALAIGVEVTSAFIHCAKAFRRGSVWDPAAWPDRSGMASIACMLRDHVGARETPVEAVQESLDHSYATTMW
ncbi:MAG TPA: pyridoxamine 5'-phosphate oxidase family protein [Acidimicrobiales bacterium]|nr:pyridoxamine 5'-phosphate oxidase family protein [Acidimicrobiales bacterium]